MELKDYIRVIRRRFLWFVGVFLSVLGAYFLVLRFGEQPRFLGHLQLVVNPTRVPTLFQGLETFFPASSKLGYETRLAGLQGRGLQRLAAEKLLAGPQAGLFGKALEGAPDPARALADLLAASYRVTSVPKTELILIEVEADSREKVVAITNALAEASVEFFAQHEGKLLSEARVRAEEQVRRNREASDALVERIKAFRQERGYSERDLEQVAARRAVLVRERDELNTRWNWIDRVEQWTARRREEESKPEAERARKGEMDADVARHLSRLALVQRECADAVKGLGDVGSARGRLLGFLADRQAELERRVATAEARLSDVGQRREALGRRRELEEGQFLEFVLAKDSVVSALAGRIEEAEGRLEALRTRYTEVHPEVAALRDRLVELRAQHEKAVTRFRQNAEQEEAYQRALLDLEARVAGEERDRARRELEKASRDLATARDEALKGDLDTFALEKEYLASEVSKRDRQVEAQDRELRRLESLRMDEQGLLEQQRLLQADVSALGAFLAKAALVAEQGGASAIRPVDRFDEPLGLEDVDALPGRTFSLLWFLCVVAFLVSLGVVFVLDYLDTTLKTEHDVRRHLGLPVLGIFPLQPKGRPVLLPALPPFEGMSELFQATATLVRSAAKDLGLKVFTVTSTVPKEGKTTVCSNLAVALARKGARVILVDADLRKPQIHEVLQLGTGPGLADFLRGDAAGIEEVLRDGPAEGLRVLSCGTDPAQALPLLDSVRMRALLEELRGSADFVLCDTPPLFGAGDALTVAALCDATLFVVGAGLAEQRQVSWAKHLLVHIEARILGCLLNRAPQDAPGYYHYQLQDREKRFRA